MEFTREKKFEQLTPMPAKKVLFLSYDGLTDPLGQSQILPYLSGLCKYGHFITIISFEKTERYEKNKKIIEDLCKHHSLEWHPLVYHKNPPVLSTLYDVWQLKKMGKFLQTRSHFDIVHCRSYITSLVGLWMKKTFQIRFIFDMRGFWADERVDGGLWRLSNPVYRFIYSFFKKKERDFLRAADHVISLTHNAKNEISSWKIPHGPISVIPTCVDLDRFDPEKVSSAQENELKRSLGIKPGQFILLYLGSLGTWYMAKEMLVFFSALKKFRTDAVFLIVSPDQPELKNYEYHNEVIHFTADPARVPLFIQIANASVFFIKPLFSKKASAATKMGEILAMGVPVITNTGWGDVDFYKNLLPGFYVIDPQHGYESYLPELTAQHDKSEIRHKVSDYFALSDGLNTFNSIYQSLM